MKQWLEKQFKLSEFHSNVRTELLASLTTFVTMAYVLATVPNMMESAGLDYQSFIQMSGQSFWPV